MVLVYANHVSDKAVFSSNACTQGARNGVPRQQPSAVHRSNTRPANAKRKLACVVGTGEDVPQGVMTAAAKKRHDESAAAASDTMTTRAGGAKATKAAKAPPKPDPKKPAATKLKAATTEAARQQQVRTFFNNVVHIVLQECLLSWFEAERINYYSFANCDGPPQFTVMGWFCQERSPADSEVGEHELPLDSDVEPPVIS